MVVLQPSKLAKLGSIPACRSNFLDSLLDFLSCPSYHSDMATFALRNVYQIVSSSIYADSATVSADPDDLGLIEISIGETFLSIPHQQARLIAQAIQLISDEISLREEKEAAAAVRIAEAMKPASTCQ